MKYARASAAFASFALFSIYLNTIDDRAMIMCMLVVLAAIVVANHFQPHMAYSTGALIVVVFLGVILSRNKFHEEVTHYPDMIYATGLGVIVSGDFMEEAHERTAALAEDKEKWREDMRRRLEALRD